MHSELIIIGLNVTVVCLAYFIIYPKYCSANLSKIANNDLLATGVALLVSGSMFWNTGETFNLLLFSTNWFWFTLLTYAAIEIPIMLWYFKKHDIWSSFKI